MKAQINQHVFSALMQKLEIQPAQTNVERFNEWMLKTVKSVYYSNNNAMCNAYNRISK